MNKEEDFRQQNVSKFPEDERRSNFLNVMNACINYSSEKRHYAYNCGKLILIKSSCLFIQVPVVVPDDKSSTV
jgi:hypothetical protein